MKLETQITFTPWTIDGYSTFNFDSAYEYLKQDLKEDGIDIEDVEVEYDTKGYTQALADNWIKIINAEVLDSVVLGVTAKGKAYSPREYNFTTDSMNVEFNVDVEKLNAYVDANIAHYKDNHIKSCDGFIWFGNELDTRLHYYLFHVSLELLGSWEYMQMQFEDVQDSEYLDYKIPTPA